MSSHVITACRVDEGRLRALAGSMDPGGAYGPELGDWPRNVISRHAVAYSCGALTRAGAAREHRHDPAELQQCQELAAQAAKLLVGVEPVGSEADSGGAFLPFFITANVGVAREAHLDAAAVREAFGGTIYPPAEVVLEPLVEGGAWWQDVVDSYEESYHHPVPPRAGLNERLRPWRELMRWFHRREALREPSFVSIGEFPMGEWGGQVNYGCVFPRLALAITRSGSLVGICGEVVHT